MIAIVTDVHYRMAASLMRDLHQNRISVIACENAKYKKPLGFASKAVWKCYSLPENGDYSALLALCRTVFEKYSEKPALLPVGAATLAAVAAHSAEFEQVCNFCIPTVGQLDLMNDKTALHTLAERCRIDVPQQFAPELGQSVRDFAQTVPYPCVVKPLCGEKFGLTASARYRIVKDPAELEESYSAFFALTGNSPVVQECLTGDGYGCSVVCKDGKVLCSIAHHRIREYPVSGGPSSCCEVVDETPFLRAVCTLVGETKYSGIAMFEFKNNAENKPCLLECNPRIWGTFPLTRASGSNFAYLWFCAAMGMENVPYVRPKPVRMVYYPSDLAAMLGYLRRREFSRGFGVILDLFRPGVKNGLYERSDPRPSALYRRSLIFREK